MALVFRTDGAWGTGKGSPLTAAEVDGNFYELDQRIEEVENNAPEPNNIANIQVVGSQMTITLDDATVLGPFTLPIALFHWRDAWVADEDYNALDLFYVAGQGLYIVRVDHTSDAYEFDENAIDESSNPLYQKLVGLPSFQTFYDLDRFFPGQPTGSQLLYRHVSPRTWYLADSDASAIIISPETPPESTVSFEVTRNTLTIGFVEVDTNGDSVWLPEDPGDITFDLTDVLEVYAPSFADASMENIAITVAGRRENVSV